MRMKTPRACLKTRANSWVNIVVPHTVLVIVTIQLRRQVTCGHEATTGADEHARSVVCLSVVCIVREFD